MPCFDFLPLPVVTVGVPFESCLMALFHCDFSGTTFIDSTTLGVLVGGVKRLRTNDGQLSLVCSDRNITKIFEITGLDKVFTIYPTREEAVSAVGVPQG